MFIAAVPRVFRLLQKAQFLLSLKSPCFCPSKDPTPFLPQFPSLMAFISPAEKVKEFPCTCINGVVNDEVIPFHFFPSLRQLLY